MFSTWCSAYDDRSGEDIYVCAGNYMSSSIHAYEITIKGNLHVFLQRCDECCRI